MSANRWNERTVVSINSHPRARVYIYLGKELFVRSLFVCAMCEGALLCCYPAVCIDFLPASFADEPASCAFARGELFGLISGLFE